MKEGTVQITIKEHDRLREIERGIETGYFYYYAEYDSKWVQVYKLSAITKDTAFEILTDRLRTLERILSKKKWYQFIELKD